MSPTSVLRRGPLAGLLCVLVPVLTLAACTSGDGGSSGSPGGSGTSSTGTSSTATPEASVVVPSSSAGPTTPVPGSTSRSAGSPSTRVSTTSAPTGPLPTQTTKRPVPLRSPVTFEQGVRGEITRIRSIQGKAVAPGEISGPALAIDIVLRNGTGRRLDLNSAIVNLAYGPQQNPASALTGPPSRPLPQFLAAGRSATGTYVFQVPRDQQNSRLRLDMSYSPTAPAVVFAGSR